MTRRVTVADLFVRPRLAPNVEARQPILRCFSCGNTHSANPGDYWNYPRAFVFRCCGRPMRLVDREVRYVPARRPAETGEVPRD